MPELPEQVWTFILLAVVFIPLERLATRDRDEQPFLRRGWWNDIAHFFLTNLFAQLGIGAVLATLGWFVYLWIPERVQDAVSGQHVGFQFLQMIFLVEIGYYSGHRLMHAVPFLWRFHRVHHSSREMDWLSTQRGHPVDLIITWSITLIPVMALGYSFQVLAALQICWLVQNHLAHANVSWRLSFLSRFFVTPQVHRWHHSASPDTWNTNFAGQLLFMDWLFGTYLQRDDTPPEYGVDESRSEVGRNYPEQMVRPLIPQRWLEKLDRKDP